ncbi:MAG: hypothetical protein GXP50_03660 [Deltaproteobacteria bacterium]|nr:hypothetical protein [Deltaproteobacteria bacterium]
MAKTGRPGRPGPKSLEEKLGQVWGGLFVLLVLTLVVVLVGKACLFE